MKIRILSCAEQEFAEAIDYYIIIDKPPDWGTSSLRKSKRHSNGLLPFLRPGRHSPAEPGDAGQTGFHTACCIKRAKTAFSLLPSCT